MGLGGLRHLCDHSGGSAASPLLKLGDLQSNVHQRSQHNLREDKGMLSTGNRTLSPSADQHDYQNHLWRISLCYYLANWQITIQGKVSLNNHLGL